MSFVDAAMVGRLGKAPLAAVGIGNGLYFALTIFGMGCVLGMDGLVAQAVGAGERARARRILWQGVRVALYTGVPLTGAIALLPFILGPAGVDAEVARLTRDFMWARLPNVVPFLLFAAARSYLQAEHLTRAIVWATVVANVVNLAGNFALIYGAGLGVIGSGLASSIASVAALGVLARAVSWTPAPADPARRASDPELMRRIFRLGTPVGLTMLAEVGIFATTGVLAGRIGPDAAAGHQVALTLASLTFTVALGIASATSVLVGHAIGRGDTPAARRAGFLGLRYAAVWMASAAILFVIIPGPLARIVTNDAAAIAAAIPLIQIAAVFQLSDGTQVVAAGALRGAGDTRMALAANVFGYYAVALPVLVGLGFGAGMGAPGLWWGLCVGLTVTAVWLFARFHRLSSRPIARV
jgi:MATE family multidrug resistance protein